MRGYLTDTTPDNADRIHQNRFYGLLLANSIDVSGCHPIFAFVIYYNAQASISDTYL